MRAYKYSAVPSSDPSDLKESVTEKASKQFFNMEKLSSTKHWNQFFYKYFSIKETALLCRLSKTFNGYKLIQDIIKPEVDKNARLPCVRDQIKAGNKKLFDMSLCSYKFIYSAADVAQVMHNIQREMHRAEQDFNFSDRACKIGLSVLSVGLGGAAGAVVGPTLGVIAAVPPCVAWCLCNCLACAAWRSGPQCCAQNASSCGSYMDYLSSLGCAASTMGAGAIMGAGFTGVAVYWWGEDCYADCCYRSKLKAHKESISIYSQLYYQYGLLNQHRKIVGPNEDTISPGILADAKEELLPRMTRS